MSYHTTISFFIFVRVYVLIRNILCFQDCIFVSNYKYLGWVVEEWISKNLSARHWYSVSLFKAFLMKSFWKSEGISSWSLISPNIAPSLPRALRVLSFKLLLKYLSVMTSTQMHLLLFLIFLSRELMPSQETFYSLLDHVSASKEIIQCW